MLYKILERSNTMTRFIEAAMIDKDGFLVGTTPVQEDPMSPGNWLLPPDCVLVDLPKEIKPGYAYKLTKKKTWKEIKINQETGQVIDEEAEYQKRIEFIKRNALCFKDEYFETSETFLNALNYITQQSLAEYSVRCYNLNNLQEKQLVKLTADEVNQLIALLQKKIYMPYFE